MKLVIKQKLVALSDSFNVYDEQDNIKYKIVADIVSVTPTYRVFDSNDKLLGVIRRKIVSALPTYIITIDDKEVGKISKKLSFVHPKYDIQYKGYKAVGDIWTWNFKVENSDGKPVANIKKELMHLTSVHAIDILDDKSEIDIVMLIVIIEED